MDIFPDILKLFIDFLQLLDWHVFIATAFPQPFFNNFRVKISGPGQQDDLARRR